MHQKLKRKKKSLQCNLVGGLGPPLYKGLKNPQAKCDLVGWGQKLIDK
jgi:hypothetical protein